jgi:hypothetical protein
MRLANRKITLVSSVLFVFVFVAGASWIQKNGKILPVDPTRKVGDYNDDDTDVLQLLGRAAERLKTPVGIEVNGPIPRQAASIRVSNGTVGDIFSSIVQHAPAYKWVEADGVVNVMPRENLDSVLDVSVSHFAIRNATPEDIRTAITALPEVQAWLTQNHVTEHSFLPPIISLPYKQKSGGPRVSIHGSGASLRQIMNRIVSKSSGLHAWSFVRYGTANEYLNIQII